LSDFFRRAAHRVTILAGSWQLFLVSVLLLLAWALSGPFFGFSDTWQLVVNTSTTILTYLLGILILLEANRQSKESKVVHDELIKAIRGARNELINIDQMTEEEVDLLEAKLRRRATPQSSPRRPARKANGGQPGGRGRTGH
jgi:low affinity Fe/Cu permease